MRAARSLAVVGTVVAVAAIVSLAGGSVGFAAEPTPTPTPSVVSSPVTVVIPGPSGAPTPTPSPSRTSTGTGTGGPVTEADGELPTLSVDGPIPPSTPTEGASKLDLDRDRVAAGQWIVATGTGYTPGEKVQFVLYPGAIIIGSFLADATGTVEGRFRMTENAAAGDYVVEAMGWQSFHAANAPFSVVAPSDAGAFPWLWWVLVVLGVLLTALIATLIYFRRSLSGPHAGGLAPTGPTP